MYCCYYTLWPQSCNVKHSYFFGQIVPHLLILLVVAGSGEALPTPQNEQQLFYSM